MNSSINIIRVVKLRRMKWVAHIARMEKVRNSYIFVRKSEGKIQLGRVQRCGLDASGSGWGPVTGS